MSSPVAAGQFRHPLVRSAVYRSASVPAREATHRALALVTDGERDPDRRAWHLATAAPGPDEMVASELELSAGRARARGGVAAAAAFLQRSVELTSQPDRRAGRALASAGAYLQAGAIDLALELLTVASAGRLDELQRAQIELMRGQIAFAAGAGSEAAALLLTAAKGLEPLDIALARDTYLDAWVAAMFAGGAGWGGILQEASRAARSAPQLPGAPRPSDVLLDGLAVLAIDGRAAAASGLRRAVHRFVEEGTMAEALRWGWAATVPGVILWDDESWHELLVRQLQSLREVGFLSVMPHALHALGINATFRGDFARTGSAISEADAIAEATRVPFAPYASVMLAAFRGREGEASTLIDIVVKDASAGGQSVGIDYCRWASGVLYNGLRRHAEALEEASQAVDPAADWLASAFALPEVIEAASKTGETGLAAETLERLVDATSAGETNWGLGVLARSRALLSEGKEAEGSYREAIDRLARTRLRPDLGRAYLVYGEWLRRQGRRAEARAQLRAAHGHFTSMGMEAFADRAGQELSAAGETARKRAREPREDLTPQDGQIAGLAGAGLSNPEIAAQLFLSPRTVEYHLRKVFAKLQISSRHQLQRVLSDRPEGIPRERDI